MQERHIQDGQIRAAAGSWAARNPEAANTFIGLVEREAREGRVMDEAALVHALLYRCGYRTAQGGKTMRGMREFAVNVGHEVWLRAAREELDKAVRSRKERANR